MTMPTQEQTKEFWEGYGFEYRKRVEGEPFWKDGMVWVDQNGTIQFRCPPIDLDNLFGYAVPRFISEKCKELRCTGIQAYELLFRLWVQELIETSERLNSMMVTTYPTLALYRTLDKVPKVMEGSKKK